MRGNPLWGVGAKPMLFNIMLVIGVGFQNGGNELRVFLNITMRDDFAVRAS